MTRVSALASLLHTDPGWNVNALLAVVDTQDPSMAPSGTDKKMTVTEFIAGLNVLNPTGGGGGLPTGGTTGQALVKTANTDFAVGWTTISGGGGPNDVATQGLSAGQGVVPVTPGFGTFGVQGYTVPGTLLFQFAQNTNTTPHAVLTDTGVGQILWEAYNSVNSGVGNPGYVSTASIGAFPEQDLNFALAAAGRIEFKTSSYAASGVWASGTQYPNGQLVSHAGRIYQSHVEFLQAPNQGFQPDLSPNYWYDLGPGGQVQTQMVLDATGAVRLGDTANLAFPGIQIGVQTDVNAANTLTGWNNTAAFKAAWVGRQIMGANDIIAAGSFITAVASNGITATISRPTGGPSILSTNAGPLFVRVGAFAQMWPQYPFRSNGQFLGSNSVLLSTQVAAPTTATVQQTYIDRYINANPNTGAANGLGPRGMFQTEGQVVYGPSHPALDASGGPWINNSLVHTNQTGQNTSPGSLIQGVCTSAVLTNTGANRFSVQQLTNFCTNELLQSQVTGGSCMVGTVIDYQSIPFLQQLQTSTGFLGQWTGVQLCGPTVANGTFTINRNIGVDIGVPRFRNVANCTTAPLSATVGYPPGGFQPQDIGQGISITGIGRNRFIIAVDGVNNQITLDRPLPANAPNSSTVTITVTDATCDPFTNALYNIGLRNASPTVYTVPPAQTISGGTLINPIATVVAISSTGPVTAGGLATTNIPFDQIVWVINQGSFTITLPASGGYPNGQAIALAPFDTAMFQWRGLAGGWLCLSVKSTTGQFASVQIGSGGPQLISGSGNPNTANAGAGTAAPLGSIYMNTAGGTNTSIYVKQTASNTSGWVGK